MNFKKVSIKLLSVIMSVAMLLSVSATAIVAFAAESHEHEDNKLNYVSIGDSMTNGYGFIGYNQDFHDTVAGYDFFQDKNVYGEGSYALQFESWLEEQGYEVDHTKLALSGLRVEDLAFLLGITESAPADGYFLTCWSYAWKDGEFVPGTSNGHIHYNLFVNSEDEHLRNNIALQTAQMQAYYQNSIKDADIISIALGNASFNAYFIDRAMRIFNVMGSGFEPENGVNQMTLEDALAMLESEEDKQVVIETYNSLVADVLAAVPAEMIDQFKIDQLCDLAAYTAASFVLNYKAVIEWIAENNSDAEVVLVGVLNSNEGMTISGEGFNFDLGSAMGKVYDAIPRTGTRFRLADNVIKVRYCKDSGCLLSEACHLDPRGSRVEVGYFTRDTAPRAVCTRHRLVEINGESGDLATPETEPLLKRVVSLLDYHRAFRGIYTSDANYLIENRKADPAIPIPDPSENTRYEDE